LLSRIRFDPPAFAEATVSPEPVTGRPAHSLAEVNMSRIAAGLLLAVVLVAPAGAQEVAASLSVYGPFGIDDLDGALPASAELRFTMRLSDRLALEPFVRLGSDADRSDGLQGFYGAQIRQRIAHLTGKDAYAFATYGVAAYYSKYGSLAPVIGHVGFGLHQRVSARLAFRPEVQLVTFHVVPIGARFLAGLAVNLRP
jgi:hypothetical protein